MEGIYCETMMTDLHVTDIRGVQYIVCSFFDGEDKFKDRFGALIRNSFESANVPGITNGSLLDSGIAILED